MNMETIIRILIYFFPAYCSIYGSEYFHDITYTWKTIVSLLLRRQEESEKIVK
jgi:hypothetical protein